MRLLPSAGRLAAALLVLNTALCAGRTALLPPPSKAGCAAISGRSLPSVAQTLRATRGRGRLQFQVQAVAPSRGLPLSPADGSVATLLSAVPMGKHASALDRPPAA